MKEKAGQGLEGSAPRIRSVGLPGDPNVPSCNHEVGAKQNNPPLHHKVHEQSLENGPAPTPGDPWGGRGRNPLEAAQFLMSSAWYFWSKGAHSVRVCSVSFSFDTIYEQASTMQGRGHVIAGNLLLIVWETVNLDMIWHESHCEFPLRSGPSIGEYTRGQRVKGGARCHCQLLTGQKVGPGP